MHEGDSESSCAPFRWPDMLTAFLISVAVILHVRLGLYAGRRRYLFLRREHQREMAKEYYYSDYSPHWRKTVPCRGCQDMVRLNIAGGVVSFLVWCGIDLHHVVESGMDQLARVSMRPTKDDRAAAHKLAQISRERELAELQSKLAIPDPMAEIEKSMRL